MSALTGKTGQAVLACVLLSLLTGVPLFCAAEGVTNLQPLAVWDTTARVTAGLGYRENVLRSSIAPESSAFFNTSVDASFMRFTESGAYVTFFVLFDDTQYFDAPSVDYERFFSATLQAAAPIGPNDELGGQGNYLYQHQVVDLSETETLRSRMLVDGYTYMLRPYWKHTFDGSWAFQVEPEIVRQLYSGDISGYWAPAAGVRLIRSYGHRSELSLYGQAKYIEYDSREEFDSAGLAIPNTSLVYQQKEAGGQWRHNFDKERHWRTTSRLSYMSSQDSGSGYFDYSRSQVSQQLRWKNARWEIKSGARLGWYNYPEQKVGSEHFERSSIALDVRIERRLGKHWLLYSLAEHEWSMSNDALEQYNNWMVGGGAGYEF
jgi:hypothetical protein